MSVQRFRANVGAQRISAAMRANGSVLSQLTGQDSSQAAFTEQTRAEMANIIKEFNRWVNWIGDQAVEVLKDALQPTFDKSQTYVPVDTGDLKDSGYLEDRKFGKLSVVEIGYGKSGEPPYAVFVHEKTEFRHTPPTRSKYLQAALEEDYAFIQARIIAGLQEASGV